LLAAEIPEDSHGSYLTIM